MLGKLVRLSLSETLTLLTLNLMENEMIKIDPEAILLASKGGKGNQDIFKVQSR